VEAESNSTNSVGESSTLVRTLVDTFGNIKTQQDESKRGMQNAANYFFATLTALHWNTLTVSIF